MLTTFFLVFIYCIATTVSIVLLGDRSLISGNLFRFETLFSLITNWKFILAMSSAVLARITFVLINNSLLKNPNLAPIATTITVFITLLSLIFIVIANYFFLNEKLSVQQAVGAVIILTGVVVMMK